MRLLLKIGYNEFVVAKGVDYSALIEAVTTAKGVNRDYVGGKYVYLPTDSAEVEAKFINDHEVAAVTGDDEQANNIATAYTELAKEKATLQSKVWELERQLKAATTKTTTITTAIKEAVDDIPF